MEKGEMERGEKGRWREEKKGAGEEGKGEMEKEEKGRWRRKKKGNGEGKEGR